MEIGLNRCLDEPADRHLWAELGITWTKLPLRLEERPLPDLRERLRLGLDCGIRTVIDLRTYRATLALWAWAIERDLHEAGRLPTPHAGLSGARQERVWQARRDLVVHRLTERVKMRLQAAVELHADLCCDWEFWGESACPIVGGAAAFGGAAYGDLLGMAAAAIREVQPGARVWTGGNGQTGAWGWVSELVGAGYGRCFDVLNWHPYSLYSETLAHALANVQRGFDESRRALQRTGADPWWAVSEWGRASLPVMGRAARRAVEAAQVEGGVAALFADEAVEFYEASLRQFAGAGCEVAIVYNLRDTPGERHWAYKCGLLDVTGRRKPIWDVVQEWAQHGQRGRRAFETRPERDHAMFD